MLSHALRAAAGNYDLPPVYQSSTTASKSSGTTLTINKPSGVVAGDLLIAVLVANGTSGWNQLAGWTRLANTLVDPSTSFQYRIADGSEGASFGFAGANIRGSGTIMRFTNAGVPYLSTVQTGSGTSQTAPSVTITSDNSLGLSVFTADGASRTWTGVDGIPIIAFGTQCSFNIAYNEFDSGSTGTDTATMNVADTYACFQVGIPRATVKSSLFYLSSQEDLSGASSYTVTGAYLGQPATNRIIIVGVSTLNQNNPTAVSIGGISATRAVETNVSGVVASLWYASVPTGLTGDIVVTKPADITAFAWYAGYTSTPSPADTGQYTTTGNASITIDSYANGFMVWCQADRDNAATHTATWSGSGTVTTDEELVVSAGSRSGSVGSVRPTTSVTNGTFTLTGGAGADQNKVVIASWSA